MARHLLALLLLAPVCVWAAVDVAATTERYCAKCHNAVDWAGGLDLGSLDHGHVGSHAAEWEKVVLKLRAGMMPPPGKERPSQRDALALARELERRLDAADAVPTTAPSLHRLNRYEYANAIRDLLGLVVDVSGLLPSDDASGGFDNVAAGLAISPTLVQAYTMAAMKLARTAVGDMTATETVTTYLSLGEAAQKARIEGLPLGSRGGMRIEHFFPLDAEYRISVRGDFAITRSPSMQVDVALDGQRVEASTMRDIRLRLSAGRHVITAAIFDLQRATGVNEIYAGYETRGIIESIEITGPFNATGPGDTESRRRVFSCQPRAASEERACAQSIILDLAGRAFRGPQRLTELAEILRFYENGHAQAGFEAGIQQALARILVDPRFLFRIEDQPDGAAPAVTWTISDLELASRLSFFLWSSIPDRRLIDLAVGNQLHRPAVLRAEVRRMLADPKSEALVENFAGQWLHLRDVARVTPEVEGFDASLRQAFIDETRALVAWVLTQDRPATELLSADYSFLNERLARHYGIAGVRGPQLRRVTLPASAHRRGLLGHGSILTVTSTATRTSPVIRGAWILGNILGAPPPEPPPGVETNLDGDGSQVITASVRERLEAHRNNPSCASCHGMIDPLGFALENYNAIGGWRDHDGDSPVDARGTLTDGRQVNGPDELVAALMSNQELFVSNLTQKLLTYALGRAIDHRDLPAVRNILRQAAPRGYRLSELIMGVVESPGFRLRARASDASQVATR